MTNTETITINQVTYKVQVIEGQFTDNSLYVRVGMKDSYLEVLSPYVLTEVKSIIESSYGKSVSYITGRV